MSCNAKKDPNGTWRIQYRWHLSGDDSKWEIKGTSAYGAGTGRITV